MRPRLRFGWLIAVLVFSFQANAEERLGIVLIHGKNGRPEQLTPLATALAGQGYLTEQPEMCWSRGRIYDRPYLDCLNEIGAAVDRLNARDATAIVLLGMSLGGNGALGYGARHPNLKGIITLVPGHAPEFISRRPEIAADLSRARTLVSSGQGDVKTVFSDVNVRSVAYGFVVETTPNIYLSFFAPDSAGVMPANAGRISAPILYVSAEGDPSQRGRGYIFDRVPKHPLNKYVTVIADHVGVPAVSQEIVLNWLKGLMGS